MNYLNRLSNFLKRNISLNWYLDNLRLFEKWLQTQNQLCDNLLMTLTNDFMTGKLEGTDTLKLFTRHLEKQKKSKKKIQRWVP